LDEEMTQSIVVVDRSPLWETGQHE
jgi:hypothetical protein